MLLLLLLLVFSLLAVGGYVFISKAKTLKESGDSNYTEVVVVAVVVIIIITIIYMSYINYLKNSYDYKINIKDSSTKKITKK